MTRFAALYDAIDRTTSTNAKVAALAAYFRDAPPADAAWAVFFLTGRRLKRLVPVAALRAWTQELTGIPTWLLTESYAAVGDMGELIALLLDQVSARRANRTCRSPPGSRIGSCRCAKWILSRQRDARRRVVARAAAE